MRRGPREISLCLCELIEDARRRQADDTVHELLIDRAVMVASLEPDRERRSPFRHFKG